MKKVLEKINQLNQQINIIVESIEENKLTLIERVLKEGFSMEGDTYSSIHSFVKENIDLPLKERAPMFRDIEGWKPALIDYIELLQEKKKFYKKISKKVEKVK